MSMKKGTPLQTVTAFLAGAAAFLVLAAGCGSHQAPTASQGTTPTAAATSSPGASQSATAAIPAKERPFVAPPSMEGPQSGAQFVTRNGQLPRNGSEP
jgi:hypothetical protein